MMLVKETEFDVENSYGALYETSSGDQKVVAVNDIECESEDGDGLDNTGTLEIRILGFDFEIQKIEFYKGAFDVYSHINEDRVMTKTKRQINPTKILRKFGKEFKEIFETNEILKKYLPTVFAELQKYLK